MSPKKKFRRLSGSKKVSKMKLRSTKCFCKISNNAAKKLALHKLKKDGDFVDLAVCAGGTQTNVHGIVMASLSEDMMEDVSEKNGELRLDFPTEVVKILIQLVYQGTCTITNDTVEPLLHLANTYNIDLLKKVCGDFLVQNLSNESFLTYYDLSSDLCCHLKENINKFAKVNFRSLYKNGQISSHMEDLEEWLDSDDLNVGEDELFKLVMNLDKSKISQFFKFIRFTLLDSSTFNKDVINSAQFQTILKGQTALKKRIKTAAKHHNNIQAGIPIKTKTKQTETPRFSSDLVLISGGWSDAPINRIDIWDIRAKRWVSSNSNLHFGTRAYHKMVCLAGTIYLVGGYDENGDSNRYQDTLYSLDLKTMTWTEQSFMTSRRCFLSATALGNKLVVLGGKAGRRRLKSAEIYDPRTNQWDHLPDMARRRSDAACVEYEGSVYAIGGFTGQALLDEIERWDPSTNKWHISSRMRTPRSGHSADVLNGRIYVVGGFDGEERLKSVECFTPGPVMTWHHVADLLIPRSNFALSVVDGKILVCGGYSDQQRGVIANCEMYCPQTNLWSAVEDLSVPRSALDSVVVSQLSDIQVLLQRK